MGSPIGHYITNGLVVVISMVDDSWEDDFLDKLEEMLRNMGMPINRDQLKGFMNQFKDQFDALGINPEKIAKGEVNLNFDLSDLSKMFNAGSSVEDLLKNMGMDVRVDAAPVEIDPSELEPMDDETVKLPAEDVYLDGWNMSVTLDFALKGDIETEQLEIELVKNGSQIEILRSTQPKPLALVELPHPCDDVVNWTLNNGILDITLKLTPQGKALDSGDDDDLPAPGEVSIDLGNDDDDDDDGGIPIF
jgi:HSP20 family molecular chaperone IbpA